jgi:acetoin utilization deacetylase AcuC-like enzyme
MNTDDADYLVTLTDAIQYIHNFSPSFLVISAGMDIYGGDTLGKFKITQEGIRAIGQRVAQLNIPTLLVMEGGYNNSALGENFVKFSSNFR